MYLSCASVCYRGCAEDEVSAMLSHIPKTGFKYVDIHGPMTWSPQAIDALEPQALKSRLSALGLKCSGLYPPGFGGENHEQIKTHAKAIVKAASLCSELGGFHVASTGAVSRKNHDLSCVIECLKQIIELLPPGNNVNIALEPHYGNIIEQMEDYDQIFSEIDHPQIGICVDTGHFHSAKVDTLSLIRKYKNKIFDVHLKDHIGTQSVAIGHGEIDLTSIFNALKDIGYNSTITLELEVKDVGNAPKYVEEAYDIMIKLIN
ncbi:MAG: sugar phosphate isomerase/epimerase family protein [bacterium]